MTYKHLLIGICTVFCFVPVVYNIQIDEGRTTPNIHEIAMNLSIVSNILDDLLRTYTAIIIKTGDRAYAEHKIKENFTIASNALESLKIKKYLYEQELSKTTAGIARRAGDGEPRAFKVTTISLSEELRALEKGNLDEVNEISTKPQAVKKTKSLSEELEELLKRHLHMKKDKAKAFNGTAMYLSEDSEALVKGYLDQKKQKFTKPQAFKGTTMYLSKELEGSVKRNSDKITDKFTKPQAFKDTSKYLSEESEDLEGRHSEAIKVKSTKSQAIKGTKNNLSDKFKAKEKRSLSEELEGSVKRHSHKKKDKYNKPQSIRHTLKYLSEELEALERHHLDEIEVKFTKPQAFKGTKMKFTEKFKAEETSNLGAMININNKEHEVVIRNDSEGNLTAELDNDWEANDCKTSSVENLCKSKKKADVNENEHNKEKQKNKSDLWLIHGGKQNSPSSRESTINFKSKKMNMKTEEENGSVEDQSVEKIMKHAVSLRDSYKDVCRQVVIRQCLRALRAVLKSVCSRGKSCKSEFKDNFRTNGQDACSKQFNNKTAVCRMGLDDFDNEAERFSEEVEDLKKRKSHNRTSAKTPEVNVLRDRYEKLCQKSKYTKCVTACNQATNKACNNSNCVKEKKKAFKRSCKRFCKIHMKYNGKTSGSDDESNNDSDSDSDDEDNDDDSDSDK